MKRLSRRRFLQLSCSAGALGLVGSYPIFIERSIILANRYRIPVPRLPAAFAGLTLVQLADIHYGLLMPLRRVRGVVRRANRLGGDLIICTGDNVHERRATREIDRVWPVLAGLAAPMGVLSVLGNHDHWADTARSLEWLRRTGQDLRHRAVPLERGGERLWLAGAGDLWEDHLPLDELLTGVPEEDCRIVLAHNPDTADSDFSARVDLMISGHTHGGQVKIPFLGTPVLPVKNKSYSSGLKESPRGTRIFISRGIGWAICPIRFNCYPEIALLELVPDRSLP